MSLNKILILGLGNTLITDDGIGIYIVRALQNENSLYLPNIHIDFAESSMGGIRLLDEIVGYRAVIIIDSIITSQTKPGSIHYFKIQMDELLHSPPTLRSGHTLSLNDMLLLGKALSYPMPKKIFILAIEVIDNVTLKESLSPELAKEFPGILSKVREKVKEILVSEV